MEHNSLVYSRGQVWYWHDPVYGKKDEENQVAFGEVTVRYSRYVLIIQNIEEIKPKSILVIPLTTNETDTRDLTMKLLNKPDQAYIKCHHLMPVSPESLREYVCTVSGSIIQKVEKELHRLLFFKVKEEVMTSSITGRPMVKVGKGRGSKQHWPLERKLEFMRYYQKNTAVDTAARFGLKTASGVSTYYRKWWHLLPETERLSPDKFEKDGRMPWTKERIMEFMEYHKEHGISKTAIHYSIEESTVVTYHGNWRRLYKLKNT